MRYKTMLLKASLLSLLPPNLILALPTTDRLPLAEITLPQLKSLSVLQKTSFALQPSQATSHDLSSSVQNDVKDGGACKPVTILFARGTTEGGNMGALVGPPFVEAVGQIVGAGNVAVQGIDYPADIPGFLAGGDAGGSKDMAALVGQVQSACPNTKLVISGYSQGGQIVHNAASMLTASQTAFISSAVIFGDPDDGKPVGNVLSSKTKIICHFADEICAGTILVLPPHLTYGLDAGEAAKFVAANI